MLLPITVSASTISSLVPHHSSAQYIYYQAPVIVASHPSQASYLLHLNCCSRPQSSQSQSTVPISTVQVRRLPGTEDHRRQPSTAHIRSQNPFPEPTASLAPCSYQSLFLLQQFHPLFPIIRQHSTPTTRLQASSPAIHPRHLIYRISIAIQVPSHLSHSQRYLSPLSR